MSVSCLYHVCIMLVSCMSVCVFQVKKVKNHIRDLPFPESNSFQKRQDEQNKMGKVREPNFCIYLLVCYYW